jgi:hypothetical protein
LQQQGSIRTHYPDLDARHAWPASIMVLAVSPDRRAYTK